MTALATDGVGLTINGVTILSGISLEVGRGELLAVIGPNGAGKTSLINVLSGLVRPTSGTVRLGDRDITGWSPHRRATAGVGRTFQTSNLLLGRTVLENVRLAARAAQRRSLWRDMRAVSARGDDVATAEESLALVGLAARAAVPAAALSHGDRRKLELAVVLAQNSLVVLLDEPMAGVNSEDVEGLVALIRSVHRDRGATVVMVEHHMNVVLDLAQRIAVMHHGALLAVDEPAAIVADPTVQSAYVGQPL